MKILFQYIAISALIMGTGPILYAQEGREGDIAILDVQYKGKAPPGLDLDFLSRTIREAGVKYTNYRIMTRENIFTILEEKKIDLSKCKEAECVVDYGRMLQADKLVSTTLTLSEGVYFLILELYDIRTAAIERSVSKQCKGCGFNELVKVVTRAAREFFTGEMGDEEKGAGRAEAYGTLQIDSDPQGATIIIDGKKAEGTTPTVIENVLAGPRKILLEKEGFIDEREVVIRANEVTELTIKIKEGKKGRGHLKVESEPAGAAVYIDGAEVGKTPMVARNIETGPHLIVLRKKQYKDVAEIFSVHPGVTETIKKVLKSPHWYLGVRTGYMNRSKAKTGEIDGSTSWLKDVRFVSFDMKYRYFSILYAGIGVGLQMGKVYLKSNSWDYSTPWYKAGKFIFDLGLIEARLPLWRRYIKSLGNEPIAIYGGLGVVDLFSPNKPASIGIRARAGVDIYWLYIGVSYYDMSYMDVGGMGGISKKIFPITEVSGYVRTDPTGFFIDAGIRFNW